MKILVDQSFPDHPKLWALADALKIDDVRALGMLVRLWCKVIGVSESGALERWTAVTIARAAGFVENADSTNEWFVEQLTACGFLDRDGEGYSIHDWLDHQGTLIQSRARNRERMRDRRHTTKSFSHQDANGKHEGAPAEPGNELLLVKKWNNHKGNLKISEVKGVQLLSALKARGMDLSKADVLISEEANCRGKKIWEVLEPIVPNHGGKGNDWQSAINDMIRGGKHETPA